MQLSAIRLLISAFATLGEGIISTIYWTFVVGLFTNIQDMMTFVQLSKIHIYSKFIQIFLTLY